MSSDRMRTVAVGMAVVALLFTGVAAVVVISRGDAVAASPQQGSGSDENLPEALPAGKRISAADIVKLKRDVVAPVLEHGDPIGLRVTDSDLRDALELGNDDVIVAFSGRPLKREWDMLDAISGTTMLDAKTIYVELRRAGKPVLVRWQVDGDLKTARRAAIDLPTKLPSVAPVPDPIIATITKIDDTHVELPRDTANKITADPQTFTKGVRGYASFSGNEGVRLYAIRPGTVLYALGIQDTDTLISINGEKTRSVDALNERLAAIKGTDNWTLEVERRRVVMKISITVK